MDDGDGAYPVEMLTGQPAEAILETVYNGSGSCSGCGCLLNPVTKMYTGDICPDCVTKKAAKNVETLMGR